MRTPSSAMPRTAQMHTAKQRLQELDALVELEAITEEQGAELGKEFQKKRWRLNLKLLVGILLVAALVTMVFRALPEEEGLLWLVKIPRLPTKAIEIAFVLAPLVAVATAVERLLETIFDSFEQAMAAVSDVVGKLREPVGWVEKELLNAYEAAQNAAEAVGVDAKQEDLKALALAEQRLAKAEERLLSWVKAPEYMAWKRALCIWGGLLVGVEVAVLADFGMLHTIGVPAPRILDMLVTGSVIGAGPGPMHSIIGMLQGGKDALAKLADLAEGRAIREAVKALKEETGPGG